MTSTSKPRVLLLFGGRSSEHAVSCVTAAGVAGAIDREKYDVLPVGITRDGAWVRIEGDLADFSLVSGQAPEVTYPASSTEGRVVSLADLEGEYDVVFPVLHGPFGEDGTLQGLMEMAEVAYVGSGVAASAIGMDKHFMKVAFEAAGFEVGPYAVITNKEWLRDPEAALQKAAMLPYPLFVKPARAGSSMGITRVTDPTELRAAVEFAREHDPKVVIEAGIEGREIECGVLEGRGAHVPRASFPGEIVVADSAHTFYDFEAKYVDGAAAQLSCPAELSDQALAEIREQAARAFDAVGAEGLARVDFFYTPDGRWVINEINTMPGFTPMSMYPQMWAKTGVAYADLIDELITLALERPRGLR